MTYKKDDEIGKFCSEFDKMRLRLKQSLAKQVEFEHSRQQLIASVSHDLKTPLTSIQGYVELLSDDIVEDPETQKAYLDIIRSKSAQLNHLIDDLFTFTKLNLDEFQIELTVMDSNNGLQGGPADSKCTNRGGRAKASPGAGQLNQQR
jgi:signal transduction histidine kinase